MTRSEAELTTIKKSFFFRETGKVVFVKVFQKLLKKQIIWIWVENLMDRLEGHLYAEGLFLLFLVSREKHLFLEKGLSNKSMALG